MLTGNQTERSTGTARPNSFLQKSCQTCCFADFALGRGDWEKSKSHGGAAGRSESREANVYFSARRTPHPGCNNSIDSVVQKNLRSSDHTCLKGCLYNKCLGLLLI